MNNIFKDVLDYFEGFDDTRLEVLDDRYYKVICSKRDKNKQFEISPMSVGDKIAIAKIIKSNKEIVAFFVNKNEGKTKQEKIDFLQTEIIKIVLEQRDSLIKILNIIYKQDFTEEKLLDFNDFEIIDLLIGAYKVNVGFFQRPISLLIKNWKTQLLNLFIQEDLSEK